MDISKLQGKFITIEGGEGSSKTTCSKFLKSFFDKHNIPVTRTFDPGGCPTAQKIRHILLSKNSIINDLAEVFLFMAARIQLDKEIILPEMALGKTVICDRWFDSTIVYQCYCKGNDINFVKQLNGKKYTSKPDITFLLDVDPVVGLKRSYDVLSKDGIDESRFEDYGLEFHKKVRNSFLDLYNDKEYNNGRIKLVDANGTLEDTQKQILKIIEEL